MPLELWGGIECTVRRVGDEFHSQLHASGHWWRSRDLDAIAKLGIRRLRYPVLWELTAPEHLYECNWDWTDERLPRIRELGIVPIVGLLHHGSGPRYTDLLDPEFPEKLAQYASAVARRYPWVEHYTPVNEPLTTARFSCLYGHWYPHAKDNHLFLRALLNQCRGTVMAMQAIREVNSDARLIQTDDLGKIFSTPMLTYQAELENQRRWLGWDLVCGRVNKEHPFYPQFMAAGVSAAELQWFEAQQCPPDLIGINHYVTSNRFLHQEPDRLPACYRGGNGVHYYADVEAPRVPHSHETGIDLLLKETWDRYGLPMAITEAHLGCTREEQVRWFDEVWQGASAAQRAGVDVRAVTMWSLLGSFDWRSLLTQIIGHYEPGAFDVRSGLPRPTALAQLAQDLSSGSEPRDVELLRSPGWWHRPTRFFLPEPHSSPVSEIRLPRDTHTLARKTRPLLITGGAGTLGQGFSRICEKRGLNYHTCTRSELDICDERQVDRMLDDAQPWAVVNTAGYVRVDEAEREIARCYRENILGATVLAKSCARRRIPFSTFSTDLVFDGTLGSPYIEQDEVCPINVYGRSKAHAEKSVLEAYPHALVIRTSSFFGLWDQHNFLTCMLRALARGERFAAMRDVTVSPTFVPDLVNASLELLIDREHGVWHLTNQGKVSWAEFGAQAAKCMGVTTDRLEKESWRTLSLAAPRPLYTALTSTRGTLMPTLESALERYAEALSFT